MKKWHNAGDVAMIYMATSFLGADIFVPSKLLERAREKAQIVVFLFYILPVIFGVIATAVILIQR